ncbi:MAG TPA: polyprenyl synthetase family protein [Casimicrobiaceae bacterium]|nr:polyprenyl synthetase family protein [Casimicrobiaceae bacterium]
MMSRIDFSRHWQALKAAFERDAPHLVAGYFGAAVGRDLPLVQRLVLEGKAARGCLVLLVCEALGGRHDDAMPRAVLMECVQAATLVHDDIVDGDTLRRGRPALWTTLGVRRALLLGDLMFATSLMEAARLGHGDVATLAAAIGTVASGAYREPLEGDHDARSRHSADASLYERVIHCKTGALFGAAGRLGAIAAAASEPAAQAACTFATRLGEAYQMADDIEDLLGPGALTAQDSQKSAALAALHEHFGRPRHARAMAESGIDAIELLRPRMTREIHRRIRLARREVDDLVAGPPAALLHAAPHYIVNLQTSLDVRSSR